MTIRMTKNRQAVLTVLQQAHGARSAKDIHAALPAVDLVTIYRTLDLFVREKLITALHLTGTETLYEYQQEPHHHAVCSSCDRVVHFTANERKLAELLELKDFDIEGIDVTIRGTCDKH